MNKIIEAGKRTCGNRSVFTGSHEWEFVICFRAAPDRTKAGSDCVWDIAGQARQSLKMKSILKRPVIKWGTL